ncbi:uncharacterized protein LOC143239741 isoform X2 [Tachypleus tridentatus]|uniref:uncharacterized protein LOC143239741 isoform X2 n=1 Tax=Tachypleus tridentatus TaxID=6853 RepID=UPI003FD5F4CC
MTLKDLKQLQRKYYQMLITSQTRKYVKKKALNDRNAQEVYLNARDKFGITIFCTIADKPETQLRRRREVYKEITNRFSFLSDVPNDVTSTAETERYTQCSQKLIDAYQEDLDTNLYRDSAVSLIHAL